MFTFHIDTKATWSTFGVDSMADKEGKYGGGG